MWAVFQQYVAGGAFTLLRSEARSSSVLCKDVHCGNENTARLSVVLIWSPPERAVQGDFTPPQIDHEPQRESSFILHVSEMHGLF
jgi:hypothetical protein